MTGRCPIESDSPATRSALAYVLLNARKHYAEGKGGAPPLSGDVASRRDVAAPRTWLLAQGWRRHALIDPAELPGVR